MKLLPMRVSSESEDGRFILALLRRQRQRQRFGSVAAAAAAAAAATTAGGGTPAAAAAAATAAAAAANAAADAAAAAAPANTHAADRSGAFQPPLLLLWSGHDMAVLPCAGQMAGDILAHLQAIKQKCAEAAQRLGPEQCVANNTTRGALVPPSFVLRAKG